MFVQTPNLSKRKKPFSTRERLYKSVDVCINGYGHQLVLCNRQKTHVYYTTPSRKIHKVRRDLYD